MFISERVKNAINAEIGLEFFAHNQYLAMAAYFETKSLDKLAQFFYAQAAEELMHGMKLFKYLLEAGAEPAIPEIPAPRTGFESPVEIGEMFLSQEQNVTDKFYEMVRMAREDGDHISENFLQWFINEQLEEMSTASKLTDWFRMSGDNLLMVEMMVENLAAAGPEAPPDAGAAQ